jgi:hypothetical protein
MVVGDRSKRVDTTGEQSDAAFDHCGDGIEGAGVGYSNTVLQ